MWENRTRSQGQKNTAECTVNLKSTVTHIRSFHPFINHEWGAKVQKYRIVQKYGSR